MITKEPWSMGECESCGNIDKYGWMIEIGRYQKKFIVLCDKCMKALEGHSYE